MIVTVLLENSSHNRKLPGVHGLSLHILLGSLNILYDFGPSSSLLRNCSALNIDLSKIDLAVSSHNHIDHIGGINSFIEVNKGAKVFISGSIDEHLYTNIIAGFKLNVGPKILSRNKSRLVFVEDTKELSENIHIVKYEGYKSNSTLNKQLYRKVGNEFINDDFSHESILVIEEENNLTIFSACSHHGVLDTIETIARNFPNKKIMNFVGGFHMMNPVNKKTESTDHIHKTAVDLSKYEIDYYTGHCTGEKAFAIMGKVLVGKVHKLETGLRIEI